MNLEQLLQSDDLGALKAAAYDQIAANEQGARILAALNQRIAEVTTSEQTDSPSAPAASD